MTSPPLIPPGPRILISQLLSNPRFDRHAVAMTEKGTRLFQALCRLAGVDPIFLDETAEEAIQVFKELRQEPGSLLTRLHGGGRASRR